jgi:hypothetical protein
MDNPKGVKDYPRIILGCPRIILERLYQRNILGISTRFFTDNPRRYLKKI